MSKNIYAVKTPKGKIIGETVTDKMIDAIYAGGVYDSTLEDIIWKHGAAYDDEAVRKRVKRAGYKTVPVKVVEVRGK